MSAAAPRSQHAAVLAALSDVVTVAPAHERHVSQPGDASAAYYQGAAPLAPGSTQPAVPSKDAYDPLSSSPAAPAPPHKAEGIGARFAAAFRRQTTEEKEAKRRDKERRMKGEMSRAESKNSRMDIIDRLDHSGIHGASMFHHDSPYDACSPHANRNMRRAPVGAFDPNIDPLTGKPLARGGAAAASSRPRAAQQGSGKGGLSELAQGTLRKMNQNGSELDSLPSLSASSTGSPLVGASESRTSFDDAATDATHSSLERDVEAERAYRNSRGDWGGPSKKGGARSDAGMPHADIWGVASEPWQDFAAPAQAPRSSRQGKAGGGGSGTLGVPQSGTTSAASSVLDMEAVMTGRTKSPTNANGELDIPGVSPFPERDWSADGATGGPKRSKSLIKRIKSARQNPNAPALDAGASEVELGALKGRRSNTGGAGGAHRYSPSTPPLSADGRPLGQSSAVANTGSLGRSGTLRPRGSPRNGEAATPTDASPAGSPYNESAPDLSAGAGAEGRGRAEGAGAAQLGRNGSIFGRFGGAGKAKGRAGKSAEREREVAFAR